MSVKVWRRSMLHLLEAIVLSSVVTGLLVSTGQASQLALTDRTIIDSAGRRISVAGHFRRIVSLYGAHTENLFSLNAQDRLIGVTRHEDWPPEASAKPAFSYHDDLEKFLAARPDLVVIRPMIDRGYARLVTQLERHGIVVASLQPGTIEEMFVYWRILGVLAGRQPEAEGMVARFKGAIDCMTQRTAGLPAKRRVYFEAIHDRMRTFSAAAMPIFALKTAGGVNIAADAPSRRGTNIADYGKERILSHAGQIDVYLAQVGPMNRPTVAAIKNEPGYELIKAVRDDQIFLIDERIVARPTLRMLIGIDRISRMLYPERFCDETTATACMPPDAAQGLTLTSKEEK